MHWLQMVWEYYSIFSVLVHNSYIATEFNEVCHGAGTVLIPTTQHNSITHTHDSFTFVCYITYCSIWAYKQPLWWLQIETSLTKSLLHVCTSACSAFESIHCCLSVGNKPAMRNMIYSEITKDRERQFVWSNYCSPLCFTCPYNELIMTNSISHIMNHTYRMSQINTLYINVLESWENGSTRTLG